MSNHIGTTRLDTNRVRLQTDSGLDIILFANEQVPVDRASLQEVQTISEIKMTIESLNQINFFGDYPAKLHRAVLTPDFHKGAGIPIGTVLDADGFVLPRTAGTDIGCVDADTEYLSSDGWHRIVDYDGGLVMQYDPTTGHGNLVKPIAFIKLPCNEFIRFKTKYGIDQMLSKEHKVLCWREKHQCITTAAELANEHNRLVLGSRVKFETTFTPDLSTSLSLTDNELRVHVMILADGTLRERGLVEINLKKKRKIDRCKTLLNEANIPFQEWNMTAGSTCIRFTPPIYTKDCKELWLCSLHQLEIISNECLEWDGNKSEKCFYTRSKPMADFIHYAFTATGHRGVMRSDTHYKDGAIDYRVFRYENTRIGIAGTPKTSMEIVQSVDGFKYCFTLPSGFWVMRRGNNIAMTGNCGMRLIATDILREDFGRCANLDNILRHAFFEGGRNIPLDEESRAGMLREGVIGLKPLNDGIWRHIDMTQVTNELDHTYRLGSWPTKDLWMFDDYVRGSGGISRDSAIGSIGGGNHFCEIQYVEECLDKQACLEWGLRPGMVTIMAHTGSVGLGGMVGDHFVQQSRKLHPTALKMPVHAYHPLPTVGPLAAQGDAYLSAMGLAANFATVNRLMIGAVTLRCLSDALGKIVHGRLVYDAPHNLVWTDGQRHIHRKGSTPAECDCHDHVFPDGHPVIVPGSMGDASYVLKGRGSLASLCSAPHWAGRLTARGAGRRASTNEMEAIRVVTKIDLAKVRRDIADQYKKDLMEEAPSQYKPVLPVIDTVADAGIASPVARLRPLLTIKG